MKKVLAIDMGATSIRGVIGYINEKKIVLEEVMRFRHSIIEVDGRLRWDWNKIKSNIIDILLNSQCQNLSSVSVDTWGVDFGLLDKEGELLECPLSYRDPRNTEFLKKTLKKISPMCLYKITGNQIMAINTLFQLEAIRNNNIELFHKIYKVVLLPDLINYYFTGKIYAEKTIASTTQLFDQNNKTWNYELIKNLGYNENIFPKVMENCEIIGNTKESPIEVLNNMDLQVVSIASHDTASAVATTRAFYDEKCMFLSCGTWSLLGVCTDKPVINKYTFDNQLTNEIGLNNKNLFFKNITGLYFLERTIEELESIKEYTYAEISEIVDKSSEFKSIIYMEADSVGVNDKVSDYIREYAQKTNQYIPKTDGEIFRIIYESLAFRYYDAIQDIEECQNTIYDSIQIIGGGSKSNVLCQMTADITNKTVVAGPVEATALGNVVTQLIKLGEISDVRQAHDLIINSFEYKIYKPKNHHRWMRAYEKYKTLKKEFFMLNSNNISN
ncbi:rhamnulokinase [Clostridium sp. MSJ-4]|uniref:Rhamnulokinase n=1 Tax=Clostridium simiarum TaxID=2841506 RepID=A0ABS6F373_9CLOT|nr:FGGY family carbohydrate kinase [Clostridium simiarum]MBU5592962.1 rhamnulokinase [Clostridium simiarum]